MTTSTYSSKIFEVDSIEAAKSIILTPELGLTTEERWEKETPYLTSIIDRYIKPTAETAVLDFGGGIGRMSKALIERYGCQSVVLDTSPQMRVLGNVYVDRPEFFSISREAALFGSLFEGHFDVALAIWALQHVHDLEGEIEQIHHLLKPGGKLFVVNERRRFVPTESGWIDDNKDIFISLHKRFKAEVIDVLDPEIVTEDVSKRTFCGIFRKE